MTQTTIILQILPRKVSQLKVAFNKMFKIIIMISSLTEEKKPSETMKYFFLLLNKRIKNSFCLIKTVLTLITLLILLSLA